MVSYKTIDIGRELVGQKITDFAQARNRFLETLDDEEYVLFIDSDEEAPQTLLDLCRRIRYTGLPYFRVRRVNLQDWKWYAGGSPDYNDRLVSNQVRFHGKLHEHVRPRTPYGRIDVPIIHKQTGRRTYGLPVCYFHGVRLDLVPIVFRCYVGFKYAVATIVGSH